jgi:2-alkyl-3-oxoalkanoate reductase
MAKGDVMKIFVAGATGAIGSSLVPQLVERGHSVVGTTRSESKAARLWDVGAKPVVLDILDRDRVLAVVSEEKPDAIVHQATALHGVNFLKFEKAFALTNRLRTEGTDNLLAAARAAGVERFVAQSYAGWPAARVGPLVQDETAPADPTPARQARAALDALLHVEAVVTEFGGAALRYGGFYGPGSGLEPGGEQVEAVRKRQFPLIGKGRGMWSFIHTEDAAAATVIALERGASGIFNIVDDDPSPAAEWLPYLASVVGAKPPRRLPRWMGRLLGEQLVVMMDEARGASNAKAKRELGWTPAHPSWREGFVEVLSQSTSTRQPASTRSSTQALSPS